MPRVQISKETNEKDLVQSPTGSSATGMPKRNKFFVLFLHNWIKILIEISNFSLIRNYIMSKRCELVYYDASF